MRRSHDMQLSLKNTTHFIQQLKQTIGPNISILWSRSSMICCFHRKIMYVSCDLVWPENWWCLLLTHLVVLLYLLLFKHGFVESHMNELFPMLLVALHLQLCNQQYLKKARDSKTKFPFQQDNSKKWHSNNCEMLNKGNKCYVNVWLWCLHKETAGVCGSFCKNYVITADT